MAWLGRLPKRPFEASLADAPAAPLDVQVDRAECDVTDSNERPRRRLRRLAEEGQHEELFWDAPEVARSHANAAGCIDLSEETSPPSHPRPGARLGSRFQWPTEPAPNRARPASEARGSQQVSADSVRPLTEREEPEEQDLVLLDAGVTGDRPRERPSPARPRALPRSFASTRPPPAALPVLEEAVLAGMLPPEFLGALPRPCVAGGWRASPVDRALISAASNGGALASALAQSVDQQSGPRGAHRFAATRAACPTLCRGCHSDILPGRLMIWCRRDLQRAHPAHPACLPLIRGLSRQPFAGREDVQFDPCLDAAARSAAMSAIDELPAAGGDLLPHELHFFAAGGFQEAPAPERASGSRRGGGGPSSSGGRQRLQSQLQARLQNGGDFTAEDYELLLQLDENAGGGAARAEEKCLLQSLVAALPLSKVTAGSTIAQCMICLENMEVGAKIRTLPCMHVFHRKCIDRWLCEPGRKPRCPIDQVEVRLTAFQEGPV
ncbi:ZSWIM2 [Symbiodinium natans]|uniref:ZSWIM2 protein n=1 Tax=Symbiodinium natans TaxID=878477 RepID=A0A812N5D7_9DINO|nr:ZSWIM2 [Symbiodinium natans]